MSTVHTFQQLHVECVVCHIMFISSKVERTCSIHWDLAYSVATPAGVNFIPVNTYATCGRQRGLLVVPLTRE